MNAILRLLVQKNESDYAFYKLSKVKFVFSLNIHGMILL